MNKYECVFCGNEMNPKKERVTSLLITTNWELEDKQEDQQLFCHLSCLKKAMHSSQNLYIDEHNDGNTN